MTVKITLKKPIQANGKETAELDLREPTGGDVADLGMPFGMVQSGGAAGGKIDTGVVAAYISRLAAIPPSSVRNLSPTDFFACTGPILGFFAEAMAALASESGSLSDSTEPATS